MAFHKEITFVGTHFSNEIAVTGSRGLGMDPYSRGPLIVLTHEISGKTVLLIAESGSWVVWAFLYYSFMDLKFPIIEMEAIKGLQASWEMYIIKKNCQIFFVLQYTHLIFL